MEQTSKIKSAILASLSHPEAEEGLYFDNLAHVHEEEERPAVSGDELDILTALGELIKSGQVTMDDSGEKPIFYIATRR